MYVCMYVFVACVLNLKMLICYYALLDVLGMSILLQMPNITYPTRWRRVLGDHGYKS